MKKRKRIARRACDWMDIPVEIATDEARVTLLGQDRVWIENHRGLLQYSREQIAFAAEGYEIVVLGKRLDLARSERACALVTGDIASIAFAGGNGSAG